MRIDIHDLRETAKQVLSEEVNVDKMISDLGKSFDGSNEEQMKGVQLLKGLALSNDPKANKFMQALDKATTTISNQMTKGETKESLDEVSVPDKHQKKIAIDTVKNPMKGRIMGGMSEKEAIKLLKTKFGYSDSQIKKLQQESVEEIIESRMKPLDVGFGQFLGLGRDINGNKVAKFKTNHGTSFSIQTAGNLPYLHGLRDGETPSADKIELELLPWLTKHGTPKQKKMIPESAVMSKSSIDEIAAEDDVWEYTNARGMRVKGYLKDVIDRGHNDVTYIFTNKDTGRDEVVSGMLLRDKNKRPKRLANMTKK